MDNATLTVTDHALTQANISSEDHEIEIRSKNLLDTSVVGRDSADTKLDVRDEPGR